VTSVNVAQGSTDPRIERSQAVIRRAALVELSEVGYGSLTIEAVAGRAGVGKSTIYRHWAGKPALVIDALERLNEQPRPESDDASPPERVERLVRHFAEVSVDPVVSGCLVALIDAAERDPELRGLHHRYSAQRRQTLVTAIADGVAAGDFASQTDPELASLALIGAVLYRRVMTDDPIDPDRIAGLIGIVLGGPDFEQR